MIRFIVLEPNCEVSEVNYMEETEYLYPTAEEIEDVRIVWNEHGYKLIEVELKNGERYMVESD